MYNSATWYRTAIQVCISTLPILPVACTSETQKPAITGRVLDELGNVVSTACVSIVHSSQPCAPTDTNGNFSLNVSPGTTVSLQAAAAGYAKSTRFYTATPNPALVVFLLRPVDSQVQITLPNGDAPPVSVQVNKLDGSSALIFPADAMVTSSGAVATGPATVSMTYWHPQGGLASTPGVLWAIDPDGQVPLVSFGMAEMEVSQNGNLLQVAPGRALIWQVVPPATTLPALAQGDASVMPSLYYLDPNIAEWRRDGSLVYSAQNAMFTAQLPHLSAWNVDYGLPPTNGGCSTGTLIDACHPLVPLAKSPVSLWFLSVEGIKDFHGATDSSGNYCIPTPVDEWVAQDSGSGETLAVTDYFVSAGNFNNTSMCNPAPAYCFDCDPSLEAMGESSYCSNCTQTGNNTMYPPITKGGPTSYYDPNNTEICSVATVGLQACHFCPGDPATPAECTMPDTSGAVMVGGCAELQLTVVKPTGCICQDLGSKCNPNSDTCCADKAGTPSTCSSGGECVTCHQVYTEGMPCDPANPDACCNGGAGPPLVCLDSVCVPNVDPD